MNASEMTFGIEIECFLPAQVIADNGIQIGRYHGGIQVPGLPAGWRAESDCSLRTTKRGYVPVEIVSGVLQGREGIEQVKAVVAKLKEWRFHTNPTCGLHIHVGAGLSENPIVLRNLVCLAARFERALFAVTGTKRREHGHYAGVISEDYRRVENATRLEDFRTVASKYRSLNLSPLWSPKRTVEFRVFQGTQQADKIIGYIMLCLGLVENAYAIQRKPKFNCTNYRHQTGAGLFYRLARNFNWFSEKRMGEKRYGVLVDDAELERIKNTLRRLAKKYDSDQSTAQHRALRPVVEPR